MPRVSFFTRLAVAVGTSLAFEIFSTACCLPARSFDSFEVEREFPSIGTRDLIFNGCRLDHLDLILVAIDDVTVRKEAEKALEKSQDALRQAQKMEAIGRLAGGIAHDFNNLLTAIIGNSYLIADTLDDGHEAIQYVMRNRKRRERAAALTDQLLAFSRRKVLQPRVFDVNTVVTDFERMLRRIVGEQIKVVVHPASDLWRVKADPGEIGRVLMNVCLNARDAMPAGGTLTIHTANVAIDEVEAHLHNLGAGQYVELTVRDTGTGMDPETQTHVFEPFFTTKEPGKGTGLGLATVLGIVEQSGGAIWCHSELGQGTRFKILLPAVAAVADTDAPASAAVSPKRRRAPPKWSCWWRMKTWSGRSRAQSCNAADMSSWKLEMGMKDCPCAKRIRGRSTCS